MNLRLKRPTFEHLIGGRRVLVFDAIVPRADVRAMAEAIADAPYLRKWSTTRASSFAKYWSLRYPQRTVEALPLYQAVLAYIREYFPDRRVRLDRAYVNNNAFGDLLARHADSVRGGGVTAAYYANARWSPDWGGETVFFQGKREAVVCVTPKPGRVVLFDPLLQHRGNPPLRHCYEGRLMFTFKFEPARPRRGAGR